ncbi:MAG TPA: hypothetical protein VNO55_08040 [Polyangia bacterium]|nr:hypothetical protein [Polyangia bacterium]
MKRRLFGMAAWLTVCVSACATAPAVGRGGIVYDISIASIDGYPTSDRGPAAFPACTIQVGTQVARVWLAHPSHGDAVSPVIMEGDAVALKDGILVERSWGEAVVYNVTDADLIAGAAVVYVPSMNHAPTVVELRFEPVGRNRPSQREHDLSERRPIFKKSVASSHIR